MNQPEAQSIEEALRDLKPLRANRFFVEHLLPELARLRDSHRVGMNDQTLTPAQRCEHITAWEDLQKLLEYPDVEEKRLRTAVRSFHNESAVIERRFSDAP